MPDRIYVSPPATGEAELEYIKEAFATNWIAPVGPHIDAFEEALQARWVPAHFVTALQSGTAALHLSLLLAGVDTGDEVLCQTFSFCASANPIRYVGATPIFIDSEPDTWNISPDYLEQALNDRRKKGKKTKAVIAVHAHGVPFKVEEITAICKHYGVVLIEDAAGALGSTYKNKPCGTLGDYGVFSFNGNKMVTTSGGGALVTKTKVEKDRAVYLATQAREAAPYYIHYEIGYNYRMSNICAGIGRGQLEQLPRHIKSRKTLHTEYRKMVHASNKVSLQAHEGENYESNHYLNCLIFKSTHSYNTQLQHELEAANIESRRLWNPLHLQPIFKDYPFYGSTIAENLFNSGLCLPSGSNLTEEDLHRIKKILRNFL